MLFAVHCFIYMHCGALANFIHFVQYLGISTQLILVGLTNFHNTSSMIFQRQVKSKGSLLPVELQSGLGQTGKTRGSFQLVIFVRWVGGLAKPNPGFLLKFNSILSKTLAVQDLSVGKKFRQGSIRKHADRIKLPII